MLDLAKLLSETCESHHEAFADSNGTDPDWAVWYAKHLMENKELRGCFGDKLTLAKLVYSLMALDLEYTADKPSESWSQYYAKRLEKLINQNFSN